MADKVVVVGVGNALRGDDGAGLEIARRLRDRATAMGVTVRELEDEGIGLLGLWEGADAVVVVDTVRSGAAPGAIHRLDAAAGPLSARLRGSTSTHAVGIAEAIELARALGCLPPQLVVVGVEGHRFDVGAALSPNVAAVLDEVVDAVLRQVRLLAGAS